MSAPAAPSAKPADPTLWSTLRGLWPYLWPRERPDLQRTVVVSLLLMLVAKLVTVAMPFTFQWATDGLVAASGGATPANVPGWIVGAPLLATLLYVLARIIMGGLQQLREGLFARVAMHAVRRLALETFEHMHRLSLRFHLERKTGGLTRVLERGRTGIEELTRMILMVLVPTIVEFALLLIVFGVAFDVRHVVVVALTIAGYIAFTVAATEWRMQIRRVMNDSDTDANTKAIDSLLNYETVKYFGAAERERDRYDRSVAAFERASVRTYTSLAVLNFGQIVIFTAGLGIVLAMSVQDVLAGKNSVGQFVMLNVMMIQLFIPLNFMGMVYRQIKQAVVDIEAMFAILATHAEVRDPPGAVPLRVTAGRVVFEDVHFHYEPSRPILKGVSFVAEPGRTVAIVGPSGAGKSTISRLLFRFYDIAGGRITIDGQDIRNVTQDSLREAIGMVPQDTVLFNDSIGYNIAYGRADASEAEIATAARMAQIDRFIAGLPEGYRTQVGERGLKLSGGEKQRVAIARTILKGPPILVLDEATSALDSFTEREIQGALDEVARGRTTIVIAHRLSTVINADQILVLDRGVVVERGRHAELLALGGTYAKLWERQQEVARAEETLHRARAEEEGRSHRRPIALT